LNQGSISRTERITFRLSAETAKKNSKNWKQAEQPSNPSSPQVTRKLNKKTSKQIFLNMKEMKPSWACVSPSRQ